MALAAYSTNLADIYAGAGSTTGWTALGSGGAGLNAEVDYFIQGTGCTSKNAFASAKKGLIYDNGSDAGGSGTDGAYLMWVTHLTPNSLAAIAGGGIQMLIGSGVGDYVSYYVGGSDTIEFGGWILAAVNEATAGDEADTGSPSATVEQWFGALFDLPSGGPTKGAPNGIDAIRFGRCDIIVEFGTSTDPEADFDGIITDLETASNRYGLLAELNGAFYNSGLLQLGSATNAVEFTDSNKTIFLRDHPHVTANFHTWEVQNASSIINFTNLVVKALGTTSKGRWITTDNATVNMTGCSFVDMGTFSFLTNATIDTCTFLNCGQVTHGGAVMNNSIVSGYEGSADSSALIYNIAADPNGEMDGMAFTKGTAATHAIEMGTSSPLSMTLTNIDFSGYNAADGQNDSVLHIKRTSGTVNITISGGSGTVSYRTDGATVNIISGAVTVKVTVTDDAGAVIANARVVLKASDGTGAFPFEDTVTITRSGSTATVTHTAHGMDTNDYVLIRDAVQQEYNIIAQITKIDVDSYSYTVSGTPTTPATGTILATFVALYGLSNGSGVLSTSRVYTTAQPVTGYSRKSTSSPFYKEGALSGDISTSSGYDKSAVMVSDE